MSQDDKGGAKKESPVAPTEVKETKVVTEEVSPQEPDWKELLREAREAREKAEEDRDNYKKGLLAKDRELKRRKKGIVDDEEEIAEEAPTAQSLREDIREVLREEVAPLIAGNRVDTLLASVVTDPAKREYVKELYSTRIQRTGTSEEAIRSDLETALAIANSKRISKENEELKRMSDNRIYVPPTGGGGDSDKGGGTVRKAHEWTAEQERVLENRARTLGISDFEKYKESTWREYQAGTAFAVKPKPGN